ncbi:MAG: SagB/ThcOx family dehydrogenase [Gammaproteobacteria bacterium]|nr:SagB/ThcOx family dehydrogenase [Gammaproteobacteria bacterium]
MSNNPSRNFLKSQFTDDFSKIESDQKKGVAQPEVQKNYPPDAKLINLVPPSEFKSGRKSFLDVISHRRSVRRFNGDFMNLMELSFLLWATQGVKNVNRANLRTSPSAGSRHPFETYLCIGRVTGVAPGVYRYLPLEHKLCLVYEDSDILVKTKATLISTNPAGPSVLDCCVFFIWAAVPYRAEWRYPDPGKAIALDGGHVCQNLCLAATAIDAGSCAIAAYKQAAMDELIKVDGENEFAVYMATVGK